MQRSSQFARVKPLLVLLAIAAAAIALGVLIRAPRMTPGTEAESEHDEPPKVSFKELKLKDFKYAKGGSIPSAATLAEDTTVDQIRFNAGSKAEFDPETGALEKITFDGVIHTEGMDLAKEVGFNYEGEIALLTLAKDLRSGKDVFPAGTEIGLMARVPNILFPHKKFTYRGSELVPGTYYILDDGGNVAMEEPVGHTD